MKRILTILMGLCLTLVANGQENTLDNTLPKVDKMLPAPPSVANSQYVNDYLQYKWGISVRQQTTGLLAYDFIIWTFDKYLYSLSKVLPFAISEQNTPAIYKLLQFGANYAEKMINNAHETVVRKRPYVQYGDNPFVMSMSHTYENINSYPADQAVYGWLYSLILSEVFPNQVEKILQRGYKYGPAMIISGYSYESDVHAGHFMASALLSRFHTNDEFNELLTAAKAEVKTKTRSFTQPNTRTDYTYIASDQHPSSSIYLPKVPDENSASFMCDLNQYRDGKYQRSFEIGKKAVEDVEFSLDYFCKIYSEILGVTISASATPAIYELLCHIHLSGNDATQDAKSYYMRKRPYVFMGEASAYPDDDEILRNTGSYPSGHAAESWLIALVLSEVTRSRQDDLMLRAYQYGQGRVITGFHWQSDVDAGRMVGSAVYAYLHSEPSFVTQMSKAVKEFQNVSGGSSNIRVIEKSFEEDASVYTLNGVLVNGTPNRRGIYIQGSQTVIY